MFSFCRLMANSLSKRALPSGRRFACCSRAPKTNQLLPQHEIDRVYENFAKSDLNLDKTLDMWEFNIFTQHQLGRRLDSRDLPELFKRIDLDKDGEINQVDIIKHMENRYFCLSKKVVDDAFCSYDKDKDGYLYLHEFRQILYYLGFPAIEKRLCDEVFQKYDTDNDSRISYDQFLQILDCEMKRYF